MDALPESRSGGLHKITLVEIFCYFVIGSERPLVFTLEELIASTSFMVLAIEYWPSKRKSALHHKYDRQNLYHL